MADQREHTIETPLGPVLVYTAQDILRESAGEDDRRFVRLEDYRKAIHAAQWVAQDARALVLPPPEE